ncbi:MAG: PIN domain-containing protein [Actinomycetota bacterium]
MVLIDATGLIALLANERASKEVESILRAREGAVVSVNLAEAIDVLCRVIKLDQAAVEDRLIPLVSTVMPVVAIGELEARVAAGFRVEHYHHRDTPLSLADCLLLATASIRGAEIATSDQALIKAASRVHVPVRKLPAERRG